MLAKRAITKARFFRHKSIFSVATTLGLSVSTFTSRLANTKNLGTKQFYETMDCLGYHILCVPKEQIDLEDPKYKNWIKIDLDNTNGAEVENCCPYCGHELSRKEKLYSGCPYCLTKWESDMSTKYNDSYELKKPKYPEGMEETKFTDNDPTNDYNKLKKQKDKEDINAIMDLLNDKKTN